MIAEGGSGVLTGGTAAIPQLMASSGLYGREGVEGRLVIGRCVAIRFLETDVLVSEVPRDCRDIPLYVIGVVWPAQACPSKLYAAAGSAVCGGREI
jgi:hypothetical protein